MKQIVYNKLFDDLVEVLKSDVKKTFVDRESGNFGEIWRFSYSFIYDCQEIEYGENGDSYFLTLDTPIRKEDNRYYVGENVIIEFNIPAKNNDVKSENNAISPAHYKQGDVECIDAIIAATVNKQGAEAFCVGNILKYLWRYESKNGIEDVRKAKWYLNKLEELLVE